MASFWALPASKDRQHFFPMKIKFWEVLVIYCMYCKKTPEKSKMNKILKIFFRCMYIVKKPADTQSIASG
jgi:hypothetical protein